MRTTQKQLETLVDYLNINTNHKLEPYSQDKNISFNVGTYELDSAYGGVALYQITNVDGAIDDIFGGHYTKSDLFFQLHALLKGIKIGKGLS